MFDYGNEPGVIPSDFLKSELIYRENIAIKLKVLDFLKRRNISNTNQLNLKISSKSDFIDRLNTLGTKKQYAVIKLKLNDDATVHNTRVIKAFKTHKLRKKLREIISLLNFASTRTHEKSLKADHYLVYYYSPANAKEFGYLSTWDF